MRPGSSETDGLFCLPLRTVAGRARPRSWLPGREAQSSTTTARPCAACADDGMPSARRGAVPELGLPRLWPAYFSYGKAGTSNLSPYLQRTPCIFCGRTTGTCSTPCPRRLGCRPRLFFTDSAAKSPPSGFNSRLMESTGRPSSVRYSPLPWESSSIFLDNCFFRSVS